MADPRRFGRSERAYSGVSDIDRIINYFGDRHDRRFGPSEKKYTKDEYTPSGAGLMSIGERESWHDTNPFAGSSGRVLNFLDLLEGKRPFSRGGIASLRR